MTRRRSRFSTNTTPVHFIEVFETEQVIAAVQMAMQLGLSLPLENDDPKEYAYYQEKLKLVRDMLTEVMQQLLQDNSKE